MSRPQEFDPSNLKAEIHFALDRGDTLGAEQLAENLREKQQEEQAKLAGQLPFLS